MNAVIYARYSSDKQTEQSIEGQLRDCYSYAERNDINIVGEYIDRAMSGTNDQRQDFQQMIKDSSKKQFDYVIVYKLDRFARNRYDSAIYKQKLKISGVRVLSVTEGIGEGDESIILEAVLEAMAEMYSKQLGQNVRRGLRESALKANSTGGTIPLGYRIENKKLVVDEKTAPIVKYVFTAYAAGDPKTKIVEELTNRGYRTKQGNAFTVNSFRRMIENKKYTGLYSYNGIEVEDGCPALIDKNTFDKANSILAQTRRAPGRRKAKVEYLLQGKLFCGYCGSPMVGESGHNKSNNVYNYYACAKRKKEHTCEKKNEKKDFIEWYIVEQTIEYVLNETRIEHIADKVVEQYNCEFSSSNISVLEKKSARVEREINEAVEALIKTSSKIAISKINEKIETLELQKADTDIELSKLRIANKIRINKDEVVLWIKGFCTGDPLDPEFRQRIIDVFINSIYLYDDKIVIYYNIKEGQQVSYLEMVETTCESEPECSDLASVGSPQHNLSEHIRYIFVNNVFGCIITRE